VCKGRLTVEEKAVCDKCLADLPRTRQWLLPISDPEAGKKVFEEGRFPRLFWTRLPELNKAVAFLNFRPKSEIAEIVYDFKYRHMKNTAVEMGRLAAEEIFPSGFFDGIDVLVPVPLTKSRFRQRGYNQSERLAYGISLQTGIPVETHYIIRKAFAKSQTSLSKTDRPDNVMDAFCLGKDGHEMRGKHILIIDDVVTTGATTAACARVVLQEPDTKVSIFAFGHTSH
jgi:ComF family protein